MLLYHGSKSGIQGDIKPDYFRNRNTCDFGKGFYLGDLPDQPKGLVVGRPQGRFYEIEYDNSNLKVKDFSAVDDYTTKIDCLRHVKLGKQYVLKSEEACKKESMQILVDRVLSEKEIKLATAENANRKAQMDSFIGDYSKKYRRDQEAKYIDEIMEEWNTSWKLQDEM